MMPVHGEIKKQYQPWKPYFNKEDLLTSTHSVIEAKGPFDLFSVAMEIPIDEKFSKLAKWMLKEIDTATRFSLTDGTIQVEIELWDEDESNKLYFCGDLTLNQAIKLSKSQHFAMGFVPVGKPKITVGAAMLYKKEDLLGLIRLKQQVDSQTDRPKRWKVG